MRSLTCTNEKPLPLACGRGDVGRGYESFFRSRGRTGRTTGIGSTPTSSRRARVLGIYAIGLDGCMTEEHKNVFGYIHDSMKEPSEKKRQWGMVLVQSGLPVMFLASSGG